MTMPLQNLPNHELISIVRKLRIELAEARKANEESREWFFESRDRAIELEGEWNDTVDVIFGFYCQNCKKRFWPPPNDSSIQPFWREEIADYVCNNCYYQFLQNPTNVAQFTQ